MISVLVADDHGVVREGIRRLLEAQPDIEICAQASDGEEALRAVERHHPHVVVLDVTMPGLGGLETLRRLRLLSPATRSLVLSVRGDPDVVGSAIELGADGYLRKDAGVEEIVAAIRDIARGGTHFGAGLAEDAESGLLRRLTPREIEVLRLIAEGLSAKETAERIGVSPKTVEAHRTSIMRKLALRKATELVRFAVRHGLLEP